MGETNRTARALYFENYKLQGVNISPSLAGWALQTLRARQRTDKYQTTASPSAGPIGKTGSGRGHDPLRPTINLLRADATFDSDKTTFRTTPQGGRPGHRGHPRQLHLLKRDQQIKNSAAPAHAPPERLNQPGRPNTTRAKANFVVGSPPGGGGFFFFVRVRDRPVVCGRRSTRAGRWSPQGYYPDEAASRTTRSISTRASCPHHYAGGDANLLRRQHELKFRCRLALHSGTPSRSGQRVT